MLEEKKKIKAHTPFGKGLRKGCAILITVILIFSLLCVPVSASQTSTNTFKYSVGRPSSGSGTGYLELCIRAADGTLHTRVFAWNVFQTASVTHPENANLLYNTDVSIRIEHSLNENGEHRLKFSFGSMVGDENQYICNLFTFTEGGGHQYYTFYKSGEYIYQGSANPFKGLHLYGNAVLSTKQQYTQEFYILYASEGAIYNAITSSGNTQANAIIQGQKEQTSQIIEGQQSQTDSITSNQNSNTDKVTSNQDKNTQSIIDNQNQLVENEKNEANTSGDRGVGDVLEVVPTETDGLLTAFGKLTDTMTTTEITNCNIKIPTLKIPEISPYFDEIVLLNERYVDLHDYVVLIPEDILKLLQNLFTIALIIYCFKELYSTISYVMTLRKDNDNE